MLQPPLESAETVRWLRGKGPVVSVVVTRPLMVWVSPVKGLVAVPAQVVVRVMVRVASG